MLRRLLLALVIAGSVAGSLAASLVAGCSGSGGRNPKYPRRRPGCDLLVYHGLPPGAWDDIGMTEVGCYLDESEIACLGRLRTEACRMGGDIIYNVPKSALRPIERGMIYRAMVAHTRESKKKPADDAAAPAATDAGSGPVVPLPPAGEVPAPAPPAADADAGRH